MYLGYADNNGKEYTSIGQELVKNKTMNLEDVSMHSLLKWMRENRDEADHLMHLNERYIFFKKSKNKLVLGSSKSNLEAMHSVAVDNKYIPFHIIYIILYLNIFMIILNIFYNIRIYVK